MPQIPVPDTLRVVATASRGSEQIVNVFHVERVTGSVGEAAAVADAFKIFYDGLSTAGAGLRGIRDYLQDTVLVESVTVQDIATVPYEAPYQLDIGTMGTNVGQPLPLTNTINIQWRTATASRNARGRTFLGGFTELVNDEAASGQPIITAAAMTAVGNAVTDLLANLTAIGNSLVVASLYDGVDEETGAPIPRVAGVTFPVTSAKIPNKWGTQRRRANKQLASANTIIF